MKPQEGEHPVIGKKALEAYFAGKEDFKTLSWKPFTADASRSGDMGYTIGNWTLAAPDTTYHGNYYTIWKRQADGSWKWIYDGGPGLKEPSKTTKDTPVDFVPLATASAGSKGRSSADACSA